MPVDDALAIASEIAGALEAGTPPGCRSSRLEARERLPGPASGGAGHGQALDFGLAKVTPETTAASATATPTATAPITSRGTILGTFQYIAPEQFEGAKRTRERTLRLRCRALRDHCGTSGLPGDQASLIGAILKDQPPPLGSPAGRTGIARLSVRARLAQDPDARLQSAHDIVLQLKWIAQSPEDGQAGPGAASVRSGGSAGWPPDSLGLAAAAVAWQLKPAPSELRVVYRRRYFFRRAGVRAHGPPRPGDFSDGRLVYSANQFLYLRAMNQFDSEPILARTPTRRSRSSAGCAWLAYFANGGRTLQKVAISGGAPVTLAELPTEPDGAAWQDGALLFAMNAAGASGIFSVPDTGDRCGILSRRS